MTEKEDKIWFRYKHKDTRGIERDISVRLEGFGFYGSIEDTQENPHYDTLCDLVKGFTEGILKEFELE